MMLLFFILLQR